MNLWQNQNWGPMLLNEIQEPFNSSDYLFELKFDGTRALVFANPKKVIIKNRHQIKITHLYPELQEIKKLVKENTIFDGEIVSFQNGYPSFQKLQERSHLKDAIKIKFQAKHNPVIFVCFDILYQGKNLINKPLIERKEKLEKFQNNEAFIKTKYLMQDGKSLFKEVKKSKLEGIVAKKIDSTYEVSKRTDNWLKIKNWKQEKFWIIGYIEKISISTVSLLLAEERNQKYKYVGKVTMGKRNSLYNKIKKQQKASNIVNEDISNATFIEPKYQCNIEYMERTANNHLRQPIFKEK